MPVLSATRMIALRERGIGLHLVGRRLHALERLQLHRLGRGERRAAVHFIARMLRDELLDDAVFQRVEADHHQAAVGLQHVRLASSACCSSSSSALTKIRRA
jgi:hypothetical protein